MDWLRVTGLQGAKHGTAKEKHLTDRIWVRQINTGVIPMCSIGFVFPVVELLERTFRIIESNVPFKRE